MKSSLTFLCIIPKSFFVMILLISFTLLFYLLISFNMICFGFKSLFLFLQKNSSKSILETCKLAGIKKSYWIFTAGIPPIFLP